MANEMELYLNTLHKLYQAAYGIDFPAGIEDDVPPVPVEGPYFHITNISGTDGTITIMKSGSQNFKLNLYYSKDQTEWTEIGLFGYDGYSIPVKAGEIVYFRGNNLYFHNSNGNGYQFMCDVAHNVAGCILTLIYENLETMELVTTLPQDCFGNLFQGNTTLVSAKDLNIGNVTQIGASALTNIFSGCTSLKEGMDIHQIETIGNLGLRWMYNGCTALEKAYSASIWRSDAYDNWMRGVTGNGVIYKPSSVTDMPTNSTYGIPSGWTAINY